MNCSAHLYSTISTVNGDSVHCKKTEGKCQKMNGIVTDVCKRCVIGGVSVFEGDKRVAHVMRGRNGEDCDRPRPFSIIAIWAVGVLAKCRGSTVTTSSQLLHWYYVLVLGALSS